MKKKEAHKIFAGVFPRIFRTPAQGTGAQGTGAQLGATQSAFGTPAQGFADSRNKLKQSFHCSLPTPAQGCGL